MKALLLCAAITAGQMNTLQEPPVVHLPPYHDSIPSQFGGKLLELIDAPSTIFLPTDPRKLDANGEPWSIDIKNLGPAMVMVTSKRHFSVSISGGRTVHVVWNGTAYAVR